MLPAQIINIYGIFLFKELDGEQHRGLRMPRNDDMQCQTLLHLLCTCPRCIMDGKEQVHWEKDDLFEWSA